jgi:hypothetical protein
MKSKKVFVDVTIDVKKDGSVRPRLINWEDANGDEHKYEIDRLKSVCKAASTKVGGCGIRYTVMICGKETYLFDEDGKWFVEAKEYN